MTAADKIAAARALIEPLTGHEAGPWRVHDTTTIHAMGNWIDGVGKHHRDWKYASIVGEASETWDGRANARIMAAAPALRDTVAALADLADALAQENAKLRKALGFYANPENWKGDEEALERAENGDDDPETLEAMLSNVELDGGKIARDLIATPFSEPTP